MLTLEQALEQLLSQIQPLDVETVGLFESTAGRYLAEPLIAQAALPPFDNSAMDGWAVRSQDVAAAVSDRPVALQAIAKTAAGQSFDGEIGPGQCVRVFTGAPLPRGADAVVMQEDTRMDDAHTLVLEAVKPWENVRFRGEDVKEGATIALAGDKITPQRVGLIAACGIPHLKAHRPPVVAILGTGNELRDPGEALQPGEIFDSNRAMLAALIRQIGAEPMIMPVVADDLQATIEALEQAAGADAIVTCGGVSVGEFDFVKEAIRHVGGALDFWRVAIKPGKPFLWARAFGKPIFGLPGNPVSAMVTFQLLVRPALLRMAGARETSAPSFRAQLAEPVSNPGPRRHFMRVIVDGKGNVRPTGPQASHRLATLAAANALLDIPPGQAWPSGKEVEVLLLG